jgi:hypothetical protein
VAAFSRPGPVASVGSENACGPRPVGSDSSREVVLACGMTRGIDRPPFENLSGSYRKVGFNNSRIEIDAASRKGYGPVPSPTTVQPEPRNLARVTKFLEK